MTSDTQELIAKFVSSGSESAFRELVTRYFDLVYSTAVRLVDGDTHRAQDVAQMVFSDLARMAEKLSVNPMLGGWLHRHTCFVARTVMRGERRRQAREKQAAEMNALNQKGESVLARVAPILDEAINELGADDRDAILLRFFERRNLRSVGEALGMSENAAQKRVARALQELGTLLQRRGFTLSATALAGSLAAGAVTAAPAGLALNIAGSVLAKVGTTGSIGLTSGKVVLMGKLKIGLAGVFIAAALLTVIFFEQKPRSRADKTSGASQALQQQQAGNSPNVDAANRNSSLPIPTNRLLRFAERDAGQKQGNGEALMRSPVPNETIQPKMSTGLVGSPVRLYARSGSKLRIEGTSNIHDWQVESTLIGGSLEVGPGFPLEPGQAVEQGPLSVNADVFVMVRSLKSVDKDGRPYSDRMDEVMYEHLKAKENPKISFHLTELILKEAGKNRDAPYVFEAKGQIASAGVTNEMTMSVNILPLGHKKFKVSGGTNLKMTDFRVEPPNPLGLGIKTGDEMKISFNWMVGPRASS